jgi:monolysocardiolipin acyltransferase
MPPDDHLPAPSLPWRTASAATIVFIGLASKTFLTFASSAQWHGLEGFLKLLDERKEVKKRNRGLLTGNDLRSPY